MKIFFILFLSSLLLYSCEKQSLDTTPHPPLTLTDTIVKDLAYGPEARNTLDLYLPKNRTSQTKLIILIHGGGWSSGDKNELSFFAKGLKNKNFVIANINYQLSPKGGDNYKMQLDDIGKVIGYLKTKSAFYTYGTENIYLTGHSAGAHLALAYSYTRNTDNAIKAVAGMASPTDLYSLSYYNASLVDGMLIPYLGGEREKIKQRYIDASPNSQVTPKSLPTLLFYGELDFLVTPDQAQILESTLRKNGVEVKKVPYPFMFHDWWGTPLFLDDTYKQTAEWFNKY